jgi:hypothetical protein
VLFGFLLFNYCKGIDLSEIVTGVISFTNLVNKSSVTPFKKVHKNYGKPADKKTSKIITKAQQQIDEILDKISQSGYDSLRKKKKFCLKLESISLPIAEI